jgi:hypothetical protein
MSARHGLAVLVVLGLTAGCSESKLRAGHCERDTDCPSGQVCVLEGAATFTCVASDGGLPDGDGSEVAPECTTSSQCPAEKPICDAQTCRACDGARSGDGAACASRDSARPVCGPNGACVECVSAMSADCAANPAKPICDPTSNTCVGCATDVQCVAKGVSPGLCMSHQDGRCASDSEVIYVENKGGCASSAITPMAGSSGTPFCGPQVALDVVSATRSVMVISGVVTGFSWLDPRGSIPISIIGRNAAVIAGGAAVGIQVSGVRDLYGRDVTVRSSEQEGVIVQNGATLRLDRVTVDSNRRGGILLDGAAFDIRNSRITNNGPSADLTWGGIRVQRLPASGPTEVHLVTIADNRAPGLSCAVPIQGDGVLASGNSTGDIASTCGITACSPAGPTCGAP